MTLSLEFILCIHFILPFSTLPSECSVLDCLAMQVLQFPGWVACPGWQRFISHLFSHSATSGTEKPLGTDGIIWFKLRMTLTSVLFRDPLDRLFQAEFKLGFQSQCLFFFLFLDKIFLFFMVRGRFRNNIYICLAQERKVGNSNVFILLFESILTEGSVHKELLPLVTEKGWTSHI